MHRNIFHNDTLWASLDRGIRQYDWVMIFAVLTLVSIGLLSLFSTTQPHFFNFYKQLIWLGVGTAVFFFLSSLDYRIFRVHSAPVLFLYAFGVLGVASVYLVGTTIRGSRSWIDAGFFSIEPAEIVKIVLVLILAKYFSMRHVEMYRLQHIMISGFYILIPAVLIILQPDIGSFLILIAIWIGMIIVAGIPPKHLIALGTGGVFLSVFIWSFVLRTYQQARIFSFFDPSSDPLGSGYNSIQSVVAAASGGFWGKGVGRGSQSQLGFLPEVQTDFIYAAITEELGLFMALVVLILFGIFFWRMMLGVRLATNNFARLTIMGFTILIATQLFLSIAMNLGLAPITGVTLPFLSYGGSSLITLFAALGIVQSIIRHSTQSYQIPESFEG